MEAAPVGSTFVWYTHPAEYPRKLAKALGRSDLIVVSDRVLTEECRDWLRGLRRDQIVLDHDLDVENPCYGPGLEVLRNMPK